MNDFSKARNFAASKASGEWILVLDADEYVDRESFVQFKEKLKEYHVENILSVQIVSFIGIDGAMTQINHHERLYKNNGEIRYYRNIHETLKHINPTEEKRGIADLQIYHSGYMKLTIDEKDKNQRNLALLEQKENKDEMDYFYLGNEYMNRKKYNQAILCFQKSYKMAEKSLVNGLFDW